ncbi:MAG: sigma-70 family RNA polymerase sigma factor [Candidatus Magasanikbacteria bacterium]|nr:sigma-70 family RNA polymerase sigma factor [Candidatus Magasanikbacteria bacterium]
MSNISKKLQERWLLQKIAVKKDADAFATIYDSYIDQIYRFIYFKVGNSTEAEDLTSTVFLNLWKYLTDTKKKNIESVSGLIYTIARRLVVDLYRERAKTTYTSIEEADPFTPEEITEKISTQQDTDRLLQHMKQLKQEYQEVLHLKYLDELSTAEIANVLGKTTTNVRVLLHRATKKLQDLMGQ